MLPLVPRSLLLLTTTLFCALGGSAFSIAEPAAAEATQAPALVPPAPDAAPGSLLSEAEIRDWLRRGNEGHQRVPASKDGRTWVISPKGAPGAKGTREQPLATIAEALEHAQPGDRVFLTAGTYSEPVRFPRSGKPGQPILLEGERGPNGEWLSILDLGKPLTNQWEPAPEIGPGVFKCPVNGQPPFCLTSRGKQILRINERLMELPWERESALRNEPLIAYGHSFFRGLNGEPKISGFRFLVMPEDGKIVTKHGPISFWDGIEAVYGVHNNTIYLRFRDGRDPAKEVIRAAPEGNAITIDGKSHLVVRDLSIRGAAFAIMITGKEATHNVIEENFLQHGRDRITLTRQTAHNLIRANEITLSFYGSDDFGLTLDGETGDRSEGERKGGFAGRQSEIRTGLYRAFKHIQGTDASADIGIRVQTAGPGNRIVGNHIYNGLKGIHCMGSADLEVSGNVVHNMSSLTLVTLPGLQNAHIHDNLLANANILLRIHRYAPEPKRSEYHYRNIFRLPENDGRHIYVHYEQNVVKPDPVSEPEVAIYHNTFVGGVRGLICGSFRRSVPMSRTMVLNNIISTRHEPVSYLQNHGSTPSFDGHLYRVFDYNWVGGKRTSSTLPSWFGPHNINAPGEVLWPANTLEPLLPPPAVQEKGIDLSRPFTIGDHTYAALPGMEPGYFNGSAPDLGAIQHKVK